MSTQRYIFRFWQKFIQAINTRSFRNYHQPLNRQRRFLLLMAATGLVASACGRNIAQTNNQSSNLPSTATKSIQHVFGEIQIPVNPQKIVALDISVLEAVVALGVQPIAAPAIITDNLLHLELNNKSLVDIGHPRRPNIEKILALKPDLILTSKILTQSDQYALLSEIAPTVVFDVENETQWQKTTSLCAQALGKQEQAKKLVNDYETRLQNIRTQLSKYQKPKVVSVVFLLAKTISSVGKESFSGTVLENLGIQRPQIQNQGRTSPVSTEKISEIDADTIFVLNPRSQTKIAVEARKNVDKMQKNPLWNQLQAVKANQVHEVDAHWFGMGYVAANLILDDLSKYLG